MELDGLVKRTLSQIERVKGELREQREILENTLANNETYQLHDKQAKEAAKIRAQTKSQLNKLPAMMAANDKIKELRSQYKDSQESLSNILGQYQKQTGATEFETENGELLDIISEVRLVKRGR